MGAGTSCQSRNCFKAALLPREIFKEPQLSGRWLTFRELKSPETKPVPIVREPRSSGHFGPCNHCIATHSEDFPIKEKDMYKAQLFLGQQWDLRLSKPFGWLFWTGGFLVSFVT